MKVLYPAADKTKGQGGLGRVVPMLARIRTQILTDAGPDSDVQDALLVQALDDFLRANASALLLLQNPGAPDAADAYAPTWPKLERFWTLFLRHAGADMVLAAADAIARDAAMVELAAGRATIGAGGVILANDA